MSIDICQHCGKRYDQDFEVEHPEECSSNPTSSIDFQKENFDEFVKDNWSELVAYAEESTGESFSGQEPLLTKDGIIDEAREIWNEEISKHK